MKGDIWQNIFGSKNGLHSLLCNAIQNIFMSNSIELKQGCLAWVSRFPVWYCIYYRCLRSQRGFSSNQEILKLGQNWGPAGLKEHTVRINSTKVFLRVLNINIWRFYCIKSHARGELARNLMCLVLLDNVNDIACLLLTFSSHIHICSAWS